MQKWVTLQSILFLFLEMTWFRHLSSFFLFIHCSQLEFIHLFRGAWIIAHCHRMLLLKACFFFSSVYTPHLLRNCNLHCNRFFCSSSLLFYEHSEDEKKWILPSHAYDFVSIYFTGGCINASPAGKRRIVEQQQFGDDNLFGVNGKLSTGNDGNGNNGFGHITPTTTAITAIAISACVLIISLFAIVIIVLQVKKKKQKKRIHTHTHVPHFVVPLWMSLFSHAK